MSLDRKIIIQKYFQTIKHDPTILANNIEFKPINNNNKKSSSKVKTLNSNNFLLSTQINHIQVNVNWLGTY